MRKFFGVSFFCYELHEKYSNFILDNNFHTTLLISNAWALTFVNSYIKFIPDFQVSNSFLIFIYVNYGVECGEGSQLSLSLSKMPSFEFRFRFQLIKIIVKTDLSPPEVFSGFHHQPMIYLKDKFYVCLV